MGTSYVVGVDVGTMGTKAALYDEQGVLHGSAFEESKLFYPKPGWVEQSPEDIYGSVIRTIRSAVEASGVAACDIVSLALDGQMAGVCTIDADWNAATYYDSWLDNRCVPQIRQLKRCEDEILASSGCVPSYSHGPKMLYWRDAQPEAWSRIAAFLPPAAYAAGRLAGLKGRDAFMDRTYLNFSTFGDTARSRWNDDLLGEFGLTTEKLPRITEPWEIVGRITRDAASATGLQEGTPIAAGCGDQAANVLGAGIVEPGTVFDTSGTASVFSSVIDRFETDRTYRTLMTCPHVVPGLYYAMAYVAGGGLNLRWFRDAFCADETSRWQAEGRNPYEALDAMAGEVPRGADGLLFIPHLGGRNTPNDTNVRGAFFGLTWKHGKGHMYRAIMESLAFEYATYLRSVKVIAPGLSYTRALNIGGGARSRIFKQIKADTLGMSYHSLARDEFGTLGSAIVAGHAVGLFDSLAGTAAGLSRTAGPTIEPDPAALRIYEPYAEFYARLLDGTTALFERHAMLPS